MRRGLISALVTLLVLVVAVFGVMALQPLTVGEELGGALGLSLPQAAAEESSDSHGFLGDGLRLVKLTFSDADGGEIERQIAALTGLWQEGMPDGEVAQALEACCAAEQGWPAEGGERCWWFFKDRWRYEKDTPLTERGAYNYTAALYDGENCTLYYLELDT